MQILWEKQYKQYNNINKTQILIYINIKKYKFVLSDTEIEREREKERKQRNIFLSLLYIENTFSKLHSSE